SVPPVPTAIVDANRSVAGVGLPASTGSCGRLMASAGDAVAATAPSPIATASTAPAIARLVRTAMSQPPSSGLRAENLPLRAPGARRHRRGRGRRAQRSDEHPPAGGPPPLRASGDGLGHHAVALLVG